MVVESAKGGIVSACGWTFHRPGFDSCQWKKCFVHPWCLHRLLDLPNLLSNDYRGPLPDVDAGRSECDDSSLFSTEIRIVWSCSFLSWCFFKHRGNLVIYLYLLKDYTKYYITKKTHKLYFTLRLAAKSEVKMSPSQLVVLLLRATLCVSGLEGKCPRLVFMCDLQLFWSLIR
jgi:hypothetical protein